MRAAPPLSRAADIDMALFGLSQIAWPLSEESGVETNFAPSPNGRQMAAG
jgi:hypothetical protein